MKNKYPGSQISTAITMALARMGDAAIDPLIGLLQDEEQNIFLCENNGDPLEVTGSYPWGPRAAAARALAWIEAGNTGPKKSLDPLVKALSNDNKDAGVSTRAANVRVQVEAAIALGQLGDPGAVEPLIHALQDDFYQVRACAAWTLGQLGDSRATGPIRSLLEDKKESVRLTAIDALGSLEDPRAYDALFALLNQKGSYYKWCKYVSRSMARMGSEVADKLVSELANEERPVYSDGNHRDSGHDEREECGHSTHGILEP